MINYFKKIINNLKKAKKNFRNAKKTVGNWHEELGRLEENAGLQENLWKDLEAQNKLPSVVANSAQVFSQNLYDQSEFIFNEIQNIKAKDLFSTTVFITDTGSSTAVSGAVFSFPSKNLPKSYYNLVDNLKQKNRQGEISKKLKTIDNSLSEEYDNAWTALYTLPKDKTRTPMFLMREVITQLINRFAPKEIIQGLYRLKNKKDVYRSHQIKYISSKIQDANKRKAFLDAEKSFNDIYDLLSKAHKQGKLNIKETEGFLYQADALIDLFLNSSDELKNENQRNSM